LLLSDLYGRLHFRYRDPAGEVQTLPLDGKTQITVNGETTAYSRRKTDGNGQRLRWTLPDGSKVKIGKRAKVPDKATNGTPISFDFDFDAKGNLAISITTD